MSTIYLIRAYFADGSSKVLQIETADLPTALSDASNRPGVVRATWVSTKPAVQFSEYTFIIGAHFLSALVNGDYSGLTDAESATFNKWLTKVRANYIHGSPHHWSTTDNSNEFGRCEVTDLHGPVEEITLCVRMQS